jgi:FtsH-binding integral membrane protein
LWLTGIGWLVSHYLFARHGEFGDLPSPWEPWWLRLHGAAMMAFLVSFGALLPGHIAHGLRRRRNATTGVLMLAVVAALTLSGYALYYAGDGSLRAWLGTAHWVVGLAAAASLTLHAWIGRRRTRRAREQHARIGARAALRT